MIYDIFISYAHVDDEPLPGAAQGWVTTLVRGLKSKLAMELGRRDAYRLWMDYELRGNDAVTPAIHKILDGTGVLVLFLSKGYLASSWCREELKRFVERVGSNSTQIFVVALRPVDEMPDAISDLKTYPFWVADVAGQPRQLAVPEPDPTERIYYDLQEDLARDLARQIGARRSAGRPSSATVAPPVKPVAEPVVPSGFTVFVNGGEEDLDLAREIAKRLCDRGFGCTLPLAATKGFDPATVKAAELRRDRDWNLKECDAVLMPFRDGPVTQVRQHIGAWKTAAARRKGGSPELTLFQENPDPMAVGLFYPEMKVRILPELRADDCVRRFAEFVAIEGGAS